MGTTWVVESCWDRSDEDWMLGLVSSTCRFACVISYIIKQKWFQSVTNKLVSHKDLYLILIFYVEISSLNNKYFLSMLSLKTYFNSDDS